MTEKLKKIMIISGTYLVLMTVLLIGVSTAKYTDARITYSSFGTADFNVVLLGTAEDGTAAQEGTVKQFGRTLLAAQYKPGMVFTGNSETNTAKLYSFTVANSTEEDNVSDVGVMYNVVLRTTKNLPLSYKLLQDTDGTVYQTDPVCTVLPKDENGLQWYEWTFRAPETGQGDAGQPVFFLAGGAADSNNHTLVIEWPIVTGNAGIDTNSPVYQKEVELLEVRIIAAGRNAAQALMEDPAVEPGDDRFYGKGLIKLIPGEQSDYFVDYRSFRRRSPGHYSFDFALDNGVGNGFHPTEDVTAYSVRLRVPYNTNTSAYEYTLAFRDAGAENADSEGYITLQPSETSYVLHDELAGLREPVPEETGGAAEETSEEWTETDLSDLSEEELVSCMEAGTGGRYRLYRVLTYEMQDFRLTSRKTEGDETAEVPAQADFRILLGNVAETGFPVAVQLETMAEVLTDAWYQEAD